MGLEHAGVEELLQMDGRELLRYLFRDHLDLRAVRERRVERHESTTHDRQLPPGEPHPSSIVPVRDASTRCCLAYRCPTCPAR
jgi:hypothetical protein